MPWFVGVAFLFEGGPPEELAVFFPILLETMFALTLLTLFDLVGWWRRLGFVVVLGGNGWCGYEVGWCRLVKIWWVCGMLMENRVLGEFWRGWMKVGFDW